MPLELFGSWSLNLFQIESIDGLRTLWGKDAHGLLIYSPSGHMSVSINKAVENDPSQSDAENLFDAILFYSGTYEIEGNVIRHKVTNASNPARIGKEMIRYAELQGDLLTLATPTESFGRAILVWKKI